MGYSARRGFSSGGMKVTGAQRQAEMQQKLAQMQEAMTAAQEAVDPEDVEMLQDLVVSAVNEALRQADEAMESSMSGVTGGLNLGGFGL